MGRTRSSLATATSANAVHLRLKLRPLLAFRDYNSLAERDDSIQMAVERAEGLLSVQPYEKLPRLYFYARPDAVDLKADWYYRFTYPVEQERSLDFEEDLFTPFELTFRIPIGESVYVVVSTEKKDSVNAQDLVAGNGCVANSLSASRTRCVRRCSSPPMHSLRDGARIVSRSWWVSRGSRIGGRDAMIALPGLALTTERFDVARKILMTFAQYIDRGMIPNVFPEVGETPGYNAVDASLWFVVAVWKYWKAGGDDEGALQLLPALREVIKYYREGTRYDIHADGDGLIMAARRARS